MTKNETRENVTFDLSKIKNPHFSHTVNNKVDPAWQ